MKMEISGYKYPVENMVPTLDKFCDSDRKNFPFKTGSIFTSYRTDLKTFSGKMDTGSQHRSLIYQF